MAKQNHPTKWPHVVAARVDDATLAKIERLARQHAKPRSVYLRELLEATS